MGLPDSIAGIMPGLYICGYYLIITGVLNYLRSLYKEVRVPSQLKYSGLNKFEFGTSTILDGA
jgi:hypothetical protein